MLSTTASTGFLSSSDHFALIGTKIFPAMLKLTAENTQSSDIPYDMISNPSLYAFRAGVEALHQDPTPETVDQLHMILLMDGAQSNPGVQALIPELLRHLENKELYTMLCILLGDAAHLNPPVVKLLLSHKIYSLLDYSLRISFSLVLNMCDCNREAWDAFREGHMRDEYGSDPSLKILIERYS